MQPNIRRFEPVSRLPGGLAAHTPLVIAGLVLALVCSPSLDASAQARTPSEDAERVISGGFAGLVFGLGSVGLSVALADGEGEGWLAFAIGASVLATTGVGAMGALVPETEAGSMAVVFGSAAGFGVAAMTLWVAMAGTLSDEELVAALITPLLAGPLVGIAIAAVLNAALPVVEEPETTVTDLRIVVPIAFEF